MTKEIRIIVKYKDKLVKANTEDLLAQGAKIEHTYDAINAVSVTIPINKVGKIKADSNVEYVEIDHEATILGFPADEIVDYAQIVPWGVQKIRAPEVHATGNRGAGIKVCVIDTGIDYNHPDLKDNYKGGRNFINNTDNPMDDHGHGTHVSGTIAAENNDIGVLGVAPDAYIYSCKVLNSSGSGSYSNIVAAIQWAIDNSMQVISMSLGGSSFSQALKDICDSAYNKGILLIAAAGNSGSNSDTIGYPAKFESVVAVCATDQNDARASFSSVGPDAEISAPGVNIPSTVPSGTCSMCDPSGYKNASGTSMACPHASGAAALVLSAHPEMTNVDVRTTLQETAIDLGQQGRDIYFGYGRIDAKAAVDQTPPPPQKKYKCTGSPDFQCLEDPNGPYNSLAECQTACQAPGAKYKCTGTPDFQCIEDPNGPHNSLAECQAACNAPAKKYKCTGSPDFQCVEDPNGPYTSIEACQAACVPTTSKFDVHTVGLPTKPSGILVLKISRGKYTATEACKLVCDTLNKM